jgi:cytochrome c5
MRAILTTLVIAGAAAATASLASAPVISPPRETLKPASDFANIADRKARSLALYGEMTKVIESPRCQNCHPATPLPTRGDDMHPHNPRIWSEADGHGVAGLHCNACHQMENTVSWGVHVKSVPGDPKWGLAPPSMAWQGKSVSDICRQIKDPARNGGRDLKAIHDHMAADHLVGWAWNPGEGRTPAPGTQAGFGQLVQGWIDTGAECPV